MNEIRIGYISSVSTETGMARVTYEDKDKAVTAMLPCFNQNGEYFMPQVNDMVLVVHTSNDSSMGIILGAFWNQGRLPGITGEDVFRKPLSKDGRCSIGQVAGSVDFVDTNGFFTIKEFVDLKKRVERLEQSKGG